MCIRIIGAPRQPCQRLFDLYDFIRGEGRTDAPGLLERLSPGEIEYLQELDRLRQLPPIPARPERG